MAYASIVFPTTRLQPIRQGFGDAQSDYSACLAAQSAYQMDLAKWTKEKAAYDAAVAARNATLAGQASSYASALASYTARHALWVKAKQLHDAWSAQMAGKYSGYALSVAALLKRYPNVKLAAGAPACVSTTVHGTAAAACEASTLHGLGAYDWSPYNPCFVSAYPVCTTDPPEPPKPGTEPLPPTAPKPPAALTITLRSKPTPPASCAAPPAAPAPLPVPTLVPADQVDQIDASLAPQSASSGGLLMMGLVALAVGTGAYLVLRRKPAH